MRVALLNAKSIVGNFSVALAAQGVNMLSGIVTSLLVPKVLGVEAFGYWQLFIFYISYVGFFHLGLNDGVYLVHGGESRSQIDKSSIISQFWVGMAYQVLFALAMVTVALTLVDDGNRVFVIVMTAVFLLLNNSSGYLGYVLQSMDETRSYSASVAIHGIIFLVPLVVLLLLDVKDFRAYVLFYSVAKTVAVLYCVYRTKDFFVAPKLPAGDALKRAIASIEVGAKLMIANIAGMLIMGVARFLIDANWGIETFGMVAFALSMVTFFMMFINQASMVLFPALRKANEGESVHFFESSRDCMGLFLPVCYLLYFPAVWFLSLWLPAYEPSFAFFAFLLPMCIFDGQMSVVGTTYLKVLRKESMLLAINAITVAVSAVGVLIGVYALHSLEVTILVPVACLAIRSMYTLYSIEGHFGIRHSRLSVGGVVLAIAFIACSVGLPGSWAALAVVVLYVLFLLVFREKTRVMMNELRQVLAGFKG